MTEDEILNIKIPTNSIHGVQEYRLYIKEAMRFYSDQQNSSLIKEVEELNGKLLAANEALMGVSAKWYSDLLNEKDLKISQLKEDNNKLNYAMIEWDTTHPMEAENRELQRRIKELKEALEKRYEKGLPIIIDFEEGIIAEDTNGFIGVIEKLGFVASGKTKRDVVDELTIDFKVLLAHYNNVNISTENPQPKH